MTFFSIILFLVLYAISTYNYLFFHVLVEVLTILVSWCTFQIVWRARDMFRNGFFLAIGQSYFFFGVIELLHMLSYKGMGIFLNFDANLPTQFWIAAGYFSSISFVFASLFIDRSFHAFKGMFIYLIVTILIVLSIFWGYFPDCFIEGSGLTRFKKMSEVIICFIFFTSMVRLQLYRSNFSIFVHKMLLFGLIFGIGARIAFIFYISVYGFSNMMGHCFQLISFYFIYQAFVETGISRPLELLSSQLIQEKKLSEATKQKFENLFENMTEAFAYHQILTNEKNEAIDYIFINVNERFEKFIGLKRELLLNKQLRDVLPGVHKQSKDWINIFGKVAQDRTPMKIEKFSEDHNRWFEVSIFSPQKGYFSTIFSDITDQKRTEMIQQQHYDQLEDRFQKSCKEIHNKNIELESNKKELNTLAIFFSQKLAGPTEEMLRLTTSLKDQLAKELKEKKFTHINQLYLSSFRINSQIISIIKYLQMDRNILERTIVDLNLAMKQALADIKEKIEHQNVMLVFEKLPNTFCNEWVAKNIFLNLITNAIKYNDQKVKHIVIGYLTPKYHRSDDSQKNNSNKPNIFYVNDNGIGIPIKHYENIFRFFYRLHSKDAYGGGIGAGLTLVKKMIELHGGWILVDSEPGQGTTFYFMI